MSVLLEAKESDKKKDNRRKRRMQEFNIRKWSKNFVIHTNLSNSSPEYVSRDLDDPVADERQYWTVYRWFPTE